MAHGSPEMPHVPCLRAATLDDAMEIARLASELGYAIPVDTMHKRLAVLLLHPDHRISVAAGEGRLHGWIAVEHRRTLEPGEWGEIVGLVVDARFRGTGVGRMLVLDVEQRTRALGLRAVTVRSNVIREMSHPFYENVGYVRRKTQHGYIKHLS